MKMLGPNDQSIWGWEVDPFSNKQIVWILTENTLGFRADKKAGGRFFVLALSFV